MRGRKGSVETLAAASLALLLAAGQAGAADAQPPTRFSIAPFAGYRAGGSFSDVTTGEELKLGESQNYGVVVDILTQPDGEIELLWSRQRPELDTGAGTTPFSLRVDYFHVGGTYLFPTDVVKPFFVATIGATRFDPEAEGYDSETRFSFGFGGGVRVPILRNFGLRFEARAYGTVMNNDSQALCANGRCLVDVDGTLLWQYEANAGVYLAF